MNDRLKFRIWDSEMIYSCTRNIVLRQDGTVTEGGIVLDSNCVMQSTSLRDKQDKLIFEGDILEYKEQELTYLVRFNISSAGYALDDLSSFDDGIGRGDYNFTSGIARNSIIIGNKFQNPELLRGE